jgi:3-hydroxy-9,10-secoandrosta-1,3,5(10)-triene-9,17-dione monooxygenase
VLNTNPNFQLPLIATFAYTLTGVALGIAQGAINTFCESTRQKVAKYSGARIAELTTVQLRVAEAAASADAGMLLMLRNCAEALRTATVSETPTIEQRTRYRRDGAFAGRLAAKAVDLIFECSGGAGLYDSHPIQRSFRDVHACTSHIALVFDIAGTTYGKVMLGLPCDNPLL